MLFLSLSAVCIIAPCLVRFKDKSLQCKDESNGVVPIYSHLDDYGKRLYVVVVTSSIIAAVCLLYEIFKK